MDWLVDFYLLVQMPLLAEAGGLSEAVRSPTFWPSGRDALHDQLNSVLGPPLPALTTMFRHLSFYFSVWAVARHFVSQWTKDIFNKISLPCWWMLQPSPVTFTESWILLIPDLKYLINKFHLFSKSPIEQNSPQEDPGLEGLKKGESVHNTPPPSLLDFDHILIINSEYLYFSIYKLQMWTPAMYF